MVEESDLEDVTGKKKEKKPRGKGAGKGKGKVVSHAVCLCVCFGRWKGSIDSGGLLKGVVWGRRERRTMFGAAVSVSAHYH